MQSMVYIETEVAVVLMVYIKGFINKCQHFLQYYIVFQINAIYLIFVFNDNRIVVLKNVEFDLI